MRCFIVFVALQVVGTSGLQGQAGRAGEFVFHRIVSGPMRWELTERGEVVPALQSDLSCKLRNDETGKQASTITWLIDDGSLVKKGEILARFDDSKAKEMLEKQRLVVALKKSELQQAQEEHALVRGRVETEVETAELTYKLAGLELDDAKDEGQKARLAIKKKMAELAVSQAKREMGSRVKQAEARVMPLMLEVQAADQRLKEAASQLEQCQLVAPHDGMAMMVLPDSSRLSSVNNSVGVGEPVREGQKVITVAELSRFQVVCKVHESVVNRLQPNLKAMVTVAGQNFQATVTSISPTASSTDWMSSDVKVYTTRLSLEQADRDGVRLKPGMTANVVINLAEREMAVQIPVQAVRGQQGRRFCYVKNRTGIERKDITTGINNTSVMEVLRGLKEGEQVVMNPPRMEEKKEPVKPVIPDPKPMGAIHLRSIKPADSSRRTLVTRYGLTESDLRFVHSLSPRLVAPIRQYPAELRTWQGDAFFTGHCLATTTELGEWYPALAAVSAGRFLCDVDTENLANVTVIGQEVADKLFPLGNALGETVRLGGRNRFWTVVGVLNRQQGDLARFNEAMIVPWASNRELYGETVSFRSAGTRGMESVAYSHILVRPGEGINVQQMTQMLKDRLALMHSREDWSVVSSGE